MITADFGKQLGVKAIPMPDKTLHEIEQKAWSERAGLYDALFAPVSTQAIDDILASLGDLGGKRHLDVACGTGHLVAAAMARGIISEGVDFAKPMIDIAQTSYPQALFRVADATELPHADQSLDAVTCAFGISHMEYPQTAVQEAFRVLKAGGLFAFTLWYGGSDGNDVFHIIQDALEKYATVKQELPPTWTTLRFADKQACTAITRNAGFAAPQFQKLSIISHMDSAHQVLATIEKLSVRTKMILDRQPPAIREQIIDHILIAGEARRANGIISLAWPALLTVVQKPAKGG